MKSKVPSSVSRTSELCSIQDKPDRNYEAIVSMPNEEVVIISRREKCFSCCKKFVAFLFSTIGLTSMLIGYTIFGAFIFTKLEAPHEKEQKWQVLQSRRWHIQRLWNATKQFNVLYEPNWTAVADVLLENYTVTVHEATTKGGWDGKDGEVEVKWTFAGAMLYSITVITTIGYGHITPQTTWGRVVTIFYAVVGIPLCLLTLTNLGGFMATAFRYIYNNICCGLFCLCCEKPKKDMVTTSAVTASTTAGAESPSMDGMSLPSPTGPLPPPLPPEPVTSSNGRPAPAKKVSMQVTWRSGISRVLKTEDNKTVSVPIYVSFLLIAGYILAGAMLFTLWEKDWDFLVGSYFVFITLSTIGFGDYVPGTSAESWNNQEKLVLCSMYLIFGLALIAMCFDLMQEEARNKVRTLGKKMGLIKKDKSESDVSAKDSHKAVQTTSAATRKTGKGGVTNDKKNKANKGKLKNKNAKNKEKSKRFKWSKNKPSNEKSEKDSINGEDVTIEKPVYSKGKSREQSPPDFEEISLYPSHPYIADVADV